jgi:hypothetical protein
MPRLRVPSKHKPGIAAIGALDAATANKIRNAVAQVASVPDAGTIGSLLAPLISDLGLDRPVDIADTISSLYRVRSMKEWALDDFVEAVCDSMEVNGADRAKLQNNLILLLNVESAETTAKAWGLQTEHERTFCDARIVTDLRPVFGTNIAEGPRGFVINHILKLGFHSQGHENRHEDIYVALDADDLDTMEQVILRAKAKGKSIKSNVKGFNFLARS